MARFTMALLAAVVLPVASASAATWVKLTTNKAGAIVSIDNSAIERTGSKVAAPIKWDYAAVPDEEDSVEIDYMIFDCSNETFSLDHWVYYDQTGKPVRPGKSDAPKLVPIPEKSIALMIYDRLCKIDT